MIPAHQAVQARSSNRAHRLWAGIFLLLAAGLAVLMVTESAGMFVMLSTVVTTALVVAGTGASTLWFLRVLRRLGLRLRFAPAEPGRRHRQSPFTR